MKQNTTRDSSREPAAGVSVAAIQQLADELARRGGPVRQRAAAGLRELGAVDRAVYAAVAATPTPSLDEPLRRLSNAANNSVLWLALAVGLGAGIGQAVAGSIDRLFPTPADRHVDGADEGRRRRVRQRTGRVPRGVAAT
jgi:undecaprenyl-diphosphatase